ncbi:MAG: hypothetical protein IPO26_21175 [Saprospiraceae bacterium]|nr:hypothetical protein [Saprospiraceae bacterium]
MQICKSKGSGTLRKAVIKLDEKINIANMIFTGRLLKMFPVPDDPANT